jgi:hypothetical protein
MRDVVLLQRMELERVLKDEAERLVQRAKAMERRQVERQKLMAARKAERAATNADKRSKVNTELLKTVPIRNQIHYAWLPVLK